jgi:hypothetical protein
LVIISALQGRLGTELAAAGDDQEKIDIVCRKVMCRVKSRLKDIVRRELIRAPRQVSALHHTPSPTKDVASLDKILEDSEGEDRDSQTSGFQGALREYITGDQPSEPGLARPYSNTPEDDVVASDALEKIRGILGKHPRYADLDLRVLDILLNQPEDLLVRWLKHLRARDARRSKAARRRNPDMYSTFVRRDMLVFDIHWLAVEALGLPKKTGRHEVRRSLRRIREVTAQVLNRPDLRPVA